MLNEDQESEDDQITNETDNAARQEQLAWQELPQTIEEEIGIIPGKRNREINIDEKPSKVYLREVITGQSADKLPRNNSTIGHQSHEKMNSIQPDA